MRAVKLLSVLWLVAASPAGATCTLRSEGKCLSESGQGRCLIEVGGKRYLDGRCNIESDADGNFSVGTGDRRSSKFFAYVNKNEDGTAEGSWNGARGGSHAHDSLGTLKPQGSACWANATAKVCAWR
ncbi:MULTISPECIES: hypothetical protein [unclassified Methylobacterium]|uniref:hypothetical protein n=1 Tax=unclassified Methylobacterium TaxID=2615210 RepID=UPI000152E03E|nr:MULTISPECIES: hypothetical protein [Methylobacterium]WFT81302.1 hypothetical protein QA634_05255 [Methylobacterium nodulans]